MSLARVSTTGGVGPERCVCKDNKKACKPQDAAQAQTDAMTLEFEPAPVNVSWACASPSCLG